MSLAGSLEQDWMSLRWRSDRDPFNRYLVDQVDVSGASSNAPTLSEAKSLYVEAKQAGRPISFQQTVDRAVSALIAVAGDKPIDTYTRDEANEYRDRLRSKGLSVSSVKRTLTSIRALVNFVSREKGIDEIRTFSAIYLGEGQDTHGSRRVPFSPDDLTDIQNQCRDIDDEPRWLIALISDTGMRLSEAVGLTKGDVVLDTEHPHIVLRPHPWRPLKTRGSERIVPLVGTALWAARRATEASSTDFLFPLYCCHEACRSNSASAALNKWMSRRVSKGVVLHSARHSLRDRLRAVECPRDIIDRIGGWSVAGVGESYGEGYPVGVLSKWMEKIISSTWSTAP